MSQGLNPVKNKNIRHNHDLNSMPHLKSLILTSVNMLLILSLLRAHKCRILRPRGKRHPRVIQNLKQETDQFSRLLSLQLTQINAWSIRRLQKCYRDSAIVRNWEQRVAKVSFRTKSSLMNKSSTGITLMLCQQKVICWMITHVGCAHGFLG